MESPPSRQTSPCVSRDTLSREIRLQGIGTEGAQERAGGQREVIKPMNECRRSTAATRNTSPFPEARIWASTV